MAAIQDLIKHVPIFARNLPILLVDNDEASLTSLASTLEKFSYQGVTVEFYDDELNGVSYSDLATVTKYARPDSCNVTTTTSRSEALSIIQRQQNGHFKLVMENVKTFDSENLLFLHQVVMKEDIPTVLIVSSDMMDIAAKALAEGVSFCLEKPLSLTDIKNIWQHACRRNLLANNNQLVESIDMSTDNNYQHHYTANDPLQPPRTETTVDGIGNIDHPQISSIIKRKSIDQNDADGVAKKHKAHMAADVERSLDEEDVSTSKEIECINTSSPSKRKTRRFVWTSELHLKFIAAISALGDTEARPKAILQKMNVPNLTLRQVASHLQKFKSQVQKISENGAADTSSSFQILDGCNDAAALFKGPFSSQQCEINFTNSAVADINLFSHIPAAMSLHDPSNVEYPSIFGGESYDYSLNPSNTITNYVQELDGDNSSASLGATFEPILEMEAPANLVDIPNTTTNELYNNISDEGSQILIDVSHDSNHYMECFVDILPENN